MVIFEMRYAWGTTHPIWVRHCSSHFYCDQTATYINTMGLQMPLFEAKLP